MAIESYSEVTPLTTLLDGTTDVDVLSSKYVNMKYGVAVDSIVTIDSKYEANLPGLAFDFYGDQSYWRAIMYFNGLQDPLNDVCVGALIGLPSKSSLDVFMARQDSNIIQTLVI